MTTGATHGQRAGGGTSRRRPGRKMIPRKPKLDPRTREKIALYSTDDLRHLYFTGRTAVCPLDVVKAEILWRVWCEDWISRLTLLAAVIGAAAAIIAVVEGLR
jgi:hypothetical protein